ncbi:MAG: hypothetical protein JW726_15935 [Anaerolineales bacterium]|nr:hypothetical protein [Anaerolineales bacterium]
MHEIGPQHSLAYRKEVLTPLFKLIQSMESFSLIGSASMGKTRLLDFMMRLDVQKHYFGDVTEPPWIVRVDCNRVHEVSAWAFYELLLISLSQACGKNPKASPLRGKFIDLETQLIANPQPLLAQRFFELVMNMLCTEQELQVCLLLDDFDLLYSKLPASVLANLRGVRDANKYCMCYALVLRNLPEQLRPPDDCEAFYELFSRSRIGLAPYTPEDAAVMLQQLEARRNHHITPPARDSVIALSGGHPGLTQAIYQLMVEKNAKDELPGDLRWISSQKNVLEECRKLWEGLTDMERAGLLNLISGKPLSEYTRDLLELKQLIRPDGSQGHLFSPVFEQYLQKLR